jgi:short-subunit dehydrogenase
MSKRVLIIGATSGIAEAVARRYASRGDKLFLAARNSAKLEVIAADLRARGAAEVDVFQWDANDYQQLNSMLAETWSVMGPIDVALVAHGTLPDQALCERDSSVAVNEFRTNAESVIVCLDGLAGKFEEQGNGVIAVIGSVAGDRGRASNYWYGAAKSAVDTFASGLRGRMLAHGVHVMTIKPGFVDTPMTRGLELPGALVATADRVAQDIARAIEKKKNVIYTPWFWRYIMLLISHIPGFIFKRMKF